MRQNRDTRLRRRNKEWYGLLCVYAYFEACVCGVVCFRGGVLPDIGCLFPDHSVYAQGEVVSFLVLSRGVAWLIGGAAGFDGGCLPGTVNVCREVFGM